MKLALMVCAVSIVMAGYGYAASYEWRRIEGTHSAKVVVGGCTTPNKKVTDQKCDAAGARRHDTIAVHHDDVSGKMVELKPLTSPPAQGRAIEVSDDHSTATVIGGADCGKDEKIKVDLDDLYQCEEVKE